MPRPEDSIMKFSKPHYQHPVPYIIYADFESILVPISSAEPNPKTSFSNKTNHHQASGYAYVIVGPDGKCYKKIKCYRGEDAVDKFLEDIIREKEELAEILTHVVPILMTAEDEENFKNATHCYLCQEPLFQDRCRDHDHLTGIYRGALHAMCNIQFKLRKTIPIVFHNLKQYDCHLIMQGLGKIQNHQINVIANNTEKYISFSLSKQYKKKRITIQFIDSFQFMGTSLEKLVANLQEEDFAIMKSNMPHMQLLLRKGVYPYEYMTSFSKFNETSLPPREAFFSTLTQAHISEDDYAHAQAVWNTFGLQSMGQYHDLYVKSDVLQLADVFQNFRKLCSQFYQLDCAHFVTAPGLAWQASLKMNQQPLELLTDIDMHLLVERGIRGGISMITHRWACANNPLVPEYDPTKPNSFIMYLDANNLYAHSMIEPLPFAEFEFVTHEADANWILSLEDHAEDGYIFEVDLAYPPHLHDLHNDYPLAAEKIKINKDVLSPFTLNLINNMPYVPTEKLVPNLKDKLNYIVYYRNLKYYLSLGLQLIKVHKILKFKQRAWLKPYIEFNTEQRKKATSPFQKDFFKLMNNSVYGKSMESVRRRVDIQLVNTEKKYQKLVAAPTFQSAKVFDENLVAVDRMKKTVTLDKPLYTGFVILELSKLHMYRFHYDHMKHTYGAKAQLLFTDTDSLTYCIETPDLYADMALHTELYDTSDYPLDHPLYSTKNKKKIGCFKDELHSKPVYEFVGLRAKMYSLLSSEGEKKTAKGVSRSVVAKKIKHENYKNVLFNSSITRENQYRIQSEYHKLYTIKQNKIALSPLDDKRYIQEDGIHTFAHGHYRINNQ